MAPQPTHALPEAGPLSFSFVKAAQKPALSQALSKPDIRGQETSEGGETELWESSRVWKRQQWTLQTWGRAFNNYSSCTINDQGTRSPQSLPNAGVT